MTRKSLVCIILFSMVLHCASRLDVISYLYQQRHSIAYTIGLIEEVPIAVCSSDHDFGNGLRIEHPDQHESLPASVFMAQEIQLFLSWPEVELSPAFYQLPVKLCSIFTFDKYSSPDFSIFHPPA